MENVKLVIWDMDETFWSGTLSDGDVTPNAAHIELVKHLTDRGIVNAICSKNDFEKVKEKLSSEKFHNIWNYFVFPSIDWSSKGNRVDLIISNMNLRPINCLFVDDNLSNLNEAKFINPELQTATPEEFHRLLETQANAFMGKDDSSHSRLNQYKILEKKTEEKNRATSNDEFLMQSEIKVEMIESDFSLERIHEMIHRNNQLNFTKDRISYEEVKRIFTDPKIRSGVVHVTDKYGDHGIVGCYAVKDNRLLQFVFSCRILGMGVEQYVYQQLNWPEITIVGEVASALRQGEVISYINNNTKVPVPTSSVDQNCDVRLICYGECPLRPIWAYLQPKVINSKFNEITPGPSCLNLSRMFYLSSTQKKEIGENGSP